MITRPAAVVFLYSETSVHAGTGDAAGLVDDTIQRSPVTGWPVFFDSTLRGALRQQLGPERADRLLGTADRPGVLSTPDAEILAFPVACPQGIVAWVTCARALRYFVRAVDLHGLTSIKELNELKAVLGTLGRGPEKKDTVWPANKAVTLSKPAKSQQGQQEQFVLLAADRFRVPPASDKEWPTRREAVSTLASWLADYAGLTDDYWNGLMKQQLIVLHDEAFTHYTRTETEVRTRTRIAGRRAQAHMLWTEEDLPVDCLLYSVVAETADHLAATETEGVQLPTTWLKDFVDSLKQQPVMALAGEQSLGRGWLRVRTLGGV